MVVPAVWTTISCILSNNLSPNVPRKRYHLVAIRIGLNKMAEGDVYLDYPDETLERMTKLWTVFARGVVQCNGSF